MFSASSIRPIISFCLLLLAAASGLAQEKKDGSAPAFVRLWNMQPANSPALNLLIRRGEKTTPFQSGVRWLEFAPYTPLLPEKAKFVVEDATTKKALGEVELPLEPDQYFTLVATPASNGVKLEVCNDTYSYRRGAPGRVTVRQFVPGISASVAVDGATPKTLKAGESTVFDGVVSPARLQIVVTGSNGQAVTSAYPLEFKDNNRVSCLIVQDRYQRLKTRMVYDGYVFAVDPVEAPAPGATPPAP